MDPLKKTVETALRLYMLYLLPDRHSYMKI